MTRPSQKNRIHAFECKLNCSDVDVFNLSALETAIAETLEQQSGNSQPPSDFDNKQQRCQLLRWAIVGTDRHQLFIEGAYLG